MFKVKITKAVMTDTNIVFTLTPVSAGISGELFMQVGLDTQYRVGDEFEVNKSAEIL